jgi:hypothetical protein
VEAEITVFAQNQVVLNIHFGIWKISQHSGMGSKFHRKNYFDLQQFSTDPRCSLWIMVQKRPKGLHLYNTTDPSSSKLLSLTFSHMNKLFTFRLRTQQEQVTTQAPRHQKYTSIFFMFPLCTDQTFSDAFILLLSAWRWRAISKFSACLLPAFHLFTWHWWNALPASLILFSAYYVD